MKTSKWIRKIGEQCCYIHCIGYDDVCMLKNTIKNTKTFLSSPAFIKLFMFKRFITTFANEYLK